MTNPTPTYYPLTPSQKQIWTGQLLFPDSPLYHVPYLFKFNGAINPEVLQNAFQELVNCTDILRIVIGEGNEGLEQQVLPTYTFALERIEMGSADFEKSVEKWALDRSNLPLATNKPLFDAAILENRESGFVLYLNLHHVITDAITASLLFERLSGIYDNLIQGKPALTELELPQYRDCITPLVAQGESHAQDATIRYWQDKQTRLPVFPQLGSPGKPGLDTKTTRVAIPLGSERFKKITELLGQKGFATFTRQMSLTNFFTSVLTAYLYRVSGQRAFTIGTPVHNRYTHQEKKTPGLFIGVYPLINKIDPERSFRELAASNYQELAETLGHCGSGIASTAISRNINCIVNYLPATFTNFGGMPVETKWIHPGYSDPMHYIRLHLTEFAADEPLELSADLSSDVFTAEQINSFPQNFLDILDALVAQPDETLGKISRVNPEMEALFLENFDKTALAPEPKTFLELFQEQVQNQPENTAFTLNDSAVSYAEYQQKANTWAAALKASGCQRGDTVALQLGRTEDYMFALLAIMQLGGIFIPMPSDLPAERRDYILVDSGCSFILSRSTFTTPEGIQVLTPEDLNRAEPNETPEFNSLGTADRAYIIYTSGSTGNPKGVAIQHGALGNYLQWARDRYAIDAQTVMPLFTSLGFDLTLTSTLLPLVAGGRVSLVPEPAIGPDLAALRIWSMEDITAIKLTPSHLRLAGDRNPELPNLKTLIVGGENFQTALAEQATANFGHGVAIYNEYGPTEATIGCIVHRYAPTQSASVPIGSTIAGMGAFILDEHMQLTPPGVPGEIYLSGAGLSTGYINRAELNQERFVFHPESGQRLYRTGDVGIWNTDGVMEYHGRNDEQVKVNGHRVELQEIEAVLAQFPSLEGAAVSLDTINKPLQESEANCRECGLPSEYPSADFDENNVCHLCRSFADYQNEVASYFKTEDDLYQQIRSGTNSDNKYDCLSLLSGGKDSTYVLAKLIDMGFKVLAFTLDNGYISEQAKANIDKIVTALGVDHVYGSTEHMNEIFVDSLERHANVCNGCFKTIYTLSTQIALEHEIPFIVTGLSRGQFFETRLAEETFMDFRDSGKSIDDIILEARKLYHQEDDAIKQLLETEIFNDANNFEKVQFIDFYRYTDVSLSELLRFLKEKIGWERPTDTGRSTNCLINQLGIYVHKKKKGYSNYAFPYSWDVRLGHKTREESLDEINEALDEEEIRKMMGEIGYFEDLEPTDQLVAYVAGDNLPNSQELRAYLAGKLPAYMIPTTFKKVEALPLTPNGKVDKKALQELNPLQLGAATKYVAPRNDLEELLAEHWGEVLQLEKVGIHDNFIDLGGHSLAAIRITGRINRELTLELPLSKIFEHPTVAEYGVYLENKLEELMALDDD
ncbi:amino acid adenylation domain-containing protein [Robiginitalea myxolifaciens]|uniref:Amino acid adenylation domain-containing protein n=1 Tax=Robiginitalea myxolifaciens TaxID=400055 RepID=A0A1I6FXT8_9FLAO|nr:non-ribosomal peptide synthetase [Robiginitalea myxolifaciens]SFR34765.1 amino acid adenylation domain-containing protein [Robiginitalea myxolifaciens]